MPRKTKPTGGVTDWNSEGFNEAAARCRGKQETMIGDSKTGFLASMRPRPDAAENLGMFDALVVTSSASMRPRPDAAENRRIG